jgi:hypothetical protein
VIYRIISMANLVWAIDFKGDFFLQDGTRVYPLTMEDLSAAFCSSCGH